MSAAGERATWLDRHRVAIALTLILVSGAALRVRYALPGLDSHRFWDERYSFENVRKVLDTWSLEPASIYYPSPLQTWPQALTLATSRWLYEEHGVESARLLHPRGWFTPTAYLLVRVISVVYGTLTLAVVFSIGRRLVSPGLGLLAALALAALPLHIHASSMFKPDVLLVLCVCLAFQLSLTAIQRARWADYALAGFAVCLAMSAKVTGALVGLTLAVGTVFVGWRDRQRLAKLALAAATGLASFLLLNPYARHYPAYTDHLQADYARRAALQGASRLDMPGALAQLLSGPQVHGPVFATLALLGLSWLGLTLWRAQATEPPDLTPEGRAHRAMLAAFPFLYAGAYMAATPYFKSNNLLPIIPFTALAALWLVRAIWFYLARRSPRLRSAPARHLGTAVLCFALALPGPLSVYRTLTPTTFDRALAFVAHAPGPQLGRVLVTERAAEPATVWRASTDDPARGPARIRVERLEEIERRRLDRADGEIFLARRLGDAGPGFYERRFARVPEEHRTVITPRLFELRGPPLAAVRHPHRLAAPPVRLPMSPCPPGQLPSYEGTLPDGIDPGQLISLVAVVPWGVVERTGGTPLVEVAGSAYHLQEAFRDGWTVTLVTERFVLGSSGRGVRLPTGRAREGEKAVELELRRWRQPAPREPTAAGLLGTAAPDSPDGWSIASGSSGSG